MSKHAFEKGRDDIGEEWGGNVFFFYFDDDASEGTWVRPLVS